MRDSYEHPADRRPWQAPRPDWAVGSQPQYLPARPGPSALSPAEAQPPGWAGRGLSQALRWPPEPSSAAGSGPADWTAQPAYQDRSPGHSDRPGPSPATWPAPGLYPDHADGQAVRGAALERRPDDRLAYDPYQGQPALPGRP